ncbi:hypothetical protein XENOCAPTIV_020870, partial [Xenoophorus captivus]
GAHIFLWLKVWDVLVLFEAWMQIFADRNQSVQFEISAVILVDPEYLKDRKAGVSLLLLLAVFVTLTCAFRYGREDLDVLGLSFRKDLYISTFQIPQNLPCSVTLQPGPEDTGKACGVDFEIRAFCAKSIEEKIHKRNSVRLVIRKVQYAPEKPGPQPMVETTRSFLMSDRSLHLEASLDKELYYHGEPISVNVHVTNNSTKTVKRVKISGLLLLSPVCRFLISWILMFLNNLSTFCKVYTLTPTLDKNREKRGLALDGKLKHEDTNLASSTIVKDVTNKEVLGILVSYRVKVKLVVSRGGTLVIALRVSFSGLLGNVVPTLIIGRFLTVCWSRPLSSVSQDDDFVFEDFARLRLKGVVDDKDEDC